MSAMTFLISLLIIAATAAAVYAIIKTNPVKPKPLPLPTGVFNIGGSALTASGLVFIGATADQYLRAFETATGKLLWETRLPAGGQANPMTYQGQDGRQYVVIAAGGHGGLRTRSGDYVMAYALPVSHP